MPQPHNVNETFGPFSASGQVPQGAIAWKTKKKNSQQSSDQTARRARPDADLQ